MGAKTTYLERRQMNFIMVTNNPAFARQSELAGVNRVFIDLERKGKLERQGHLDTFISNHSFEDIAPVKKILNQADLLVRLNPLHEGSSNEIEQTIDRGADIIMLPMFNSADEVADFSRMINGRVKFIPLIETKNAAEDIHNIVKVNGVDELFIGLNDLHLQMGLNFMFETVSSGYVDNLASVIRPTKIPFGFGGVARIGEGAIPAEIVLAEHLRLGSSSVILSRTFRKTVSDNFNLFDEVNKLKNCIDDLEKRSSEEAEQDRINFKKKVNEFVKGRLS